MKCGFVGVGKLGFDAASVMAEYYEVDGYDVRPVEHHSVNMKKTLEECVTGKDIVFIAVPTSHHPDYDGRYPTSHLPPKDFDYSMAIEATRQVDELVEGDLLPEVVNEFTHLGGVPLQTAHNRFQVLHVNRLVLLLVEQIKNFLQVLHFVLRELLDGLSLVRHHLVLRGHCLMLRNLRPARLELVEFLSLDGWLLFLFKLLVAHF